MKEKSSNKGDFKSVREIYFVGWGHIAEVCVVGGSTNLILEPVPLCSRLHRIQRSARRLHLSCHFSVNLLVIYTANDGPRLSMGRIPFSRFDSRIGVDPHIIPVYKRRSYSRISTRIDL